MACPIKSRENANTTPEAVLLHFLAMCVLHKNAAIYFVCPRVREVPYWAGIALTPLEVRHFVPREYSDEKRRRAIFFTNRTFADEAVIRKGCPGFFHQCRAFLAQRRGTTNVGGVCEELASHGGELKTD